LTDAPHESPAAFEAVLSLIHLITNPSQCRKRLSDLADAKAACKATIELARRERAEADTKLAELAGRVAALDQREREIKAREDMLDLELREASWRNRNKPRAESFAPRPDGQVMSREPYTEPPVVDAHYRDVPQPVFVPSMAPPPRRSMRRSAP
jgi:hypothetical protein